MTKTTNIINKWDWKVVMSKIINVQHWKWVMLTKLSYKIFIMSNADINLSVKVLWLAIWTIAHNIDEQSHWGRKWA